MPKGSHSIPMESLEKTNWRYKITASKTMAKCPIQNLSKVSQSKLAIYDYNCLCLALPKTRCTAWDRLTVYLAELGRAGTAILIGHQRPGLPDQSPLGDQQTLLVLLFGDKVNSSTWRNMHSIIRSATVERRFAIRHADKSRFFIFSVLSAEAWKGQ